MTIDPPALGSKSSPRANWSERRSRVEELLASAPILDVVRCLRRALRADGKQLAVPSPDDPSEDLDLALAAYWPVEGTSASAASDTNVVRRRAMPLLRELAATTIQERNFASETALARSLSRGGGGFCEVTRSRFDRKLYVVKSAVKRTVVASFRTSNLSPSLERHILSLARTYAGSSSSEFEGELPTPRIHAAWCSRSDVFIAMEYFAAGDLDMLLSSAGEAKCLNEMSDEKGRIHEHHTLAWGRDMVAAVSWLHSEGFMHRDIKPANWLIADSGHLKLCDFGVAAPFSPYGPTRKRLVHRSHNVITGTSDYLAPELLHLRLQRAEAAELAEAARRAEDSFGSPSYDWQSPASVRHDVVSDTAFPSAEGDYGPSIDWWGIGLVLYEMTYRYLPFVGTPAQVVEQKLNFHQHFRLDESLPRGSELKSLMRGLVALDSERLGLNSSEEVMQHPAFKGTNWSKPYSHPSPFTPKLAAENESGDQAVSVIHSPRGPDRHVQSESLMSPSVSSFNVSQHFAGIHHLPHLDSVECGSSSAADAWEKAAEGSWPTEDDTGVNESQTAVVSSPASAALARRISQRDTRADAAWSDVDTYFVGLSMLPEINAFASAEAMHKRDEEMLGEVRRQTRVRISDQLEVMSSPSEPTRESKPASSSQSTSTPYLRHGKKSEGHLASTPWQPHGQHSLHRHALETASRVASVGKYGQLLPSNAPGAFVTPMRKTSMPSFGSRFQQEARAQHGHNDHLLSGTHSAAPPVSPYPFPIASAFRPSTVAHRTGSGSYFVMRTPGVDAHGTESQTSGGSNARRNMSEQEAWNEMWLAAGSARKPKRAATLDEGLQRPKRSFSVLQSGKRSSRGGIVPASRRVARTRSTTSASEATACGPSVQASQASEVDRDGYKVPRPTRSALDTLMSKVAQIGAQTNDSRSATFSDSEPESPMLAQAGTQQQKNEMPGMDPLRVLPIELRDAAVNTSASLEIPAHNQARLQKRRSARQVLLQAQERTTPTKDSRCSSPLLIANLSNLNIDPTSAPISGPLRSAALAHSASLERGQMPMSARERTGSSCSLASVHAAQDAPLRTAPLLGAMQPPVIGARRSSILDPRCSELRERDRPQLMRRRDSSQMLAEFRQRRSPDDVDDSLELGQPLPSKLMVPSASGTAMPGSSPSMPSLAPTAVTHDQSLRPASDAKALRRASMQPMRPPNPRSSNAPALLKTRQAEQTQLPRRPLHHQLLGRHSSSILSTQTDENKPPRSRTRQVSAEEQCAKGTAKASSSRPPQSRSRQTSAEIQFAKRPSELDKRASQVSLRPVKSSLLNQGNVGSRRASSEVTLISTMSQRHAELESDLKGVESRIASLRSLLDNT
ncbi:Rho-associated, coiled-coil containing protein kinase [Ceraceosorus bombacis]|uniref:non-specific serine/threonine protein kinase n=1 Tax=Ceraceosorus bombacis TaxID=401625 RepID=A0A0P1BK50_9BASI|nr:Rho-associated, coiled-coil containing protein kinase [Ceraceosorus bombacis]